MDYFQPIPKPEMTEVIIDIAAKHFGIEDDKEKWELRALFDFYTQMKVQNSLMQAFSKPGCEKGC